MFFVEPHNLNVSTHTSKIRVSNQISKSMSTLSTFSMHLILWSRNGTVSISIVDIARNNRDSKVVTLYFGQGGKGTFDADCLHNKKKTIDIGAYRSACFIAKYGFPIRKHREMDDMVHGPTT